MLEKQFKDDEDVIFNEQGNNFSSTSFDKFWQGDKLRYFTNRGTNFGRARRIKFGLTGHGVGRIDRPGPYDPLIFLEDLKDKYPTLWALPMLVPPANVSPPCQCYSPSISIFFAFFSQLPK